MISVLDLNQNYFGIVFFSVHLTFVLKLSSNIFLVVVMFSKNLFEIFQFLVERLVCWVNKIYLFCKGFKGLSFPTNFLSGLQFIRNSYRFLDSLFNVLSYFSLFHFKIPCIQLVQCYHSCVKERHSSKVLKQISSIVHQFERVMWVWAMDEKMPNYISDVLSCFYVSVFIDLPFDAFALLVIYLALK